MQKNTTPKIDTAPAVTIPAHKHICITRHGGSVVLDAAGVVIADAIAVVTEYESTEDSEHVKKS